MDGRNNPPNPKQRYGDLKVPLGLVPPAARVYAALGHAEGAEKYGPFNWRETAVEAMTYVHAAQRHLDAWMDGNDLDPDSGKPHLGHVLASINIIIDALECGKLIDNRPVPVPTAELHRRWQKPMLDTETLATTFGPIEDYTPCSLDGRNCEHGHPAFGEGDETTYTASADRKHACQCRDLDRCLVENRRLVGNNVFCRKGEAGI